MALPGKGSPVVGVRNDHRLAERRQRLREIPGAQFVRGHQAGERAGVAVASGLIAQEELGVALDDAGDGQRPG